jgi:hypothetical protein
MKIDKKYSMYFDGGSLKSVPSDNKGLSKLPEGVRNKMGYMENGGMSKEQEQGPEQRNTIDFSDVQPGQPLPEDLTRALQKVAMGVAGSGAGKAMSGMSNRGLDLVQDLQGFLKVMGYSIDKDGMVKVIPRNTTDFAE